MNFIAKLLMNSLYGRFGLDENHSEVKILNRDEFEKVLLNREKTKDEIIDVKEFSNENFFVELKKDNTEDKINSVYKIHNSSIGIAAAITAEARIIMSQFKNNPLIDIFYTDTDSVFIKNSPDELNKIIPGIVNNKELGKMKLECEINRAIFLAPKCYYLEMANGNTQIKIKGVKKSYLDKADNIIDNFSQLIFNKWSVNVIKYPTISSVAYANEEKLLREKNITLF